MLHFSYTCAEQGVGGEAGFYALQRQVAPGLLVVEGVHVTAANAMLPAAWQVRQTHVQVRRRGI